MKSIFITGTESFVGKELILQLDKSADSYDISGCDATSSEDARFVKADIRSKSMYNLIPNNIDVIIHLAALSTDSQCRNKGYECFDVNVMGTLNLIEAAVKKKCQQFIFASSEWVYDGFDDGQEKTENSVINLANHDSEYALSKLVSESNLRQKYLHGFCDVSILRFGIIYGNRKKNWSAVESIFNTIKYRDHVNVGSLKSGRNFVHVKDIVRGIMQTIGLCSLNIINLQGNQLITLKDIIDTSQAVLNKCVRVNESDPNKVSLRKISAQKSKDIINWKPEISLEDGLSMLNEIL